MATYIALLRGVNVGKNAVPMQKLRSVLAAKGYGRVMTYIQSGNVVFDHRKTCAPALEKGMSDAIREYFGLDVPVLIRTWEEWDALPSRHPFLGKPGVDPRYLHITFLDRPPSAAAVAAVETGRFPPDACIIEGREVFLHCPGGYGKTKFNNTYFERRLGIHATTRNLKTVQALAQLGKDRH